jgi:hypothetical protein
VVVALPRDSPLPDDRWPGELGIQDHPVPLGFAAQLAYPLRRG